MHLAIRQRCSLASGSEDAGIGSHQVQRAHGINFLTPMKPHEDPKLNQDISDEFPLGGLRRT
eukprot:5469279-Amphidinium_carterae.1